MSEPFNYTVQPRKSSPWVLIVCLVIGIPIILAVLGTGMYFGLKGFRNLLPQSRAAAAVPKFAESDWGNRKIEEFTLLAPCEFGPGPNVRDQLPAEVLASVDYMDTYQGLGKSDNFIVLLSRIAYSPEIEANLEGAVHGTMAEVGARLADFAPKYDSKPVSVSGLSGRRAKYVRAFSGETMHLDTLTICLENKLWQVQVFYGHPDAAKLADRILESVEIEP